MSSGNADLACMEGEATSSFRTLRRRKSRESCYLQCTHVELHEKEQKMEGNPRYDDNLSSFPLPPLPPDKSTFFTSPIGRGGGGEQKMMQERKLSSGRSLLLLFLFHIPSHFLFFLLSFPIIFFLSLPLLFFDASSAAARKEGGGREKKTQRHASGRKGNV